MMISSGGSSISTGDWIEVVDLKVHGFANHYISSTPVHEALLSNVDEDTYFPSCMNAIDVIMRHITDEL